MTNYDFGYGLNDFALKQPCYLFEVFKTVFRLFPEIIWEEVYNLPLRTLTLQHAFR